MDECCNLQIIPQEKLLGFFPNKLIQSHLHSCKFSYNVDPGHLFSGSNLKTFQGKKGINHKMVYDKNLGEKRSKKEKHKESLGQSREISLKKPKYKWRRQPV